MPRLNDFEMARVYAADVEEFTGDLSVYRGLSDEFDWALEDAAWIIDDLRAAANRRDLLGTEKHTEELKKLATLLWDYLSDLN